MVDEAVEMQGGQQQNNIGMVVIRGNSVVLMEALDRIWWKGLVLIGIIRWLAFIKIFERCYYCRSSY